MLLLECFSNWPYKDIIGLMPGVCKVCKATSSSTTLYGGELICLACHAKIEKRVSKTSSLADDIAHDSKQLHSVLVTTTGDVEGYVVEKYIDVISAEAVMGTGLFSELSAGVSDILGKRSGQFEKKIASARKSAMRSLKSEALQLHGNAVIGMKVDYETFASNMIGVVLSGTVVRIRRLP